MRNGMNRTTCIPCSACEVHDVLVTFALYKGLASDYFLSSCAEERIRNAFIFRA